MALDCTRRSAVNLTVLHPALFDHGYMFLEKGHRHEQMEKNIIELKLISFNVPTLICDVNCMRTYFHVGHFDCYMITGIDN